MNVEDEADGGGRDDGVLGEPAKMALVREGRAFSAKKVLLQVRGWY